MITKLIITIGREAGSGGASFGKALAKALNIKFYDKELLAEAAKSSGISEDIFHEYDEKPTNSLLYNIVMNTYANWASEETNLPTKSFQILTDTIREIAKQESCVIVGRCADYALSGDESVVKIFITAPEEYKVKHIYDKYGYSKENAIKLMRTIDKNRKGYYESNTGKKWGHGDSYDLCIDISKLGVEGTVKLVLEYLTLKQDG